MQKLITLVLVILFVSLALIIFTPKKAIAEPISEPYELLAVDYQNPYWYAFRLVNRKWSNQWDFFNKIIQKESRWDYKAANPRSTAYGLCQTMLSLHDVPDTFYNDPFEQIRWCIKYIAERYGTPEVAWNHHVKYNWF